MSTPWIRPSTSTCCDQPVDVDPLDQPVDVDLLHEAVDVDPLDQPVDVDPLDEAVDIELGDQGIHVDVLQQEVEVDPFEQRVEVDPLHELLDVDPLQDLVHVDFGDELVDVDLTDDAVDVDGVDRTRHDRAEQPVDGVLGAHAAIVVAGARSRPSDGAGATRGSDAFEARRRRRAARPQGVDVGLQLVVGRCGEPSPPTPAVRACGRAAGRRSTC